MKKIWQLWLRLNGWNKFIIIILLEVCALAIVFRWLHGIILSFFTEVGLVRNKICYLVYFILLGMMMVSVFNLTIRDVRSRRWMTLWLGLTERQQFIYELMNLQVIGTMGLGFMFAIVDFQRMGIIEILVIYLVTYFAFVYLAVFYTMNTDKVKRKKHENHKIISVNNALCEIVLCEILEKLRCVETTITIALLLSLDVSLVIILERNSWVLQLIVMVLIFLSEDKAFEVCCKSAKYMATININANKYIKTQIISTALYSCIGVFAVALIYNSLKGFLICCLLGLYLSVFWTITYEYIELTEQLSVIKKVFFELINLVCVFIPGVNIVLLYRRILMIKEQW